MKASKLNEFLFENKATNQHFLGTFPACDMPTATEGCCFISNTHDHLLPGEHWNAWFFKNNWLTFMDSFGRPPTHSDFPDYYREYVKNYNYEYSTVAIQSPKSLNCGLFCLHFIYLLSYGLDFKYFLSQYYLDTSKNDAVVVRFYLSVK